MSELAKTEDGVVGEADMTVFTYVHIPADSTKPMVELVHRRNTSLEDDDLREVLKLRFAQGGNISPEQLEMYVHGLKVQIKEKMPDFEEKGVTDSQLRSLAAAVSVDTFALTVPTKGQCYAVSLYCDDKGHAKQLPLNQRAIGLANATGAKSQDFRGDCFVSRYFDDDDAWVRQNFRLDDCSSDASWVKKSAATAAESKSPGGMASLSKMYDQLGAGNGDGAGPLQIDAREEEKKLLDAEHATETYAWTQTEDEIEIRVPVGADAKSRDVAVTMKRTAVRVALKAADVGAAAPLDVPCLASPVDVDASTWYIDAGVLVMTLEKAKSGRWDALA